MSRLEPRTRPRAILLPREGCGTGAGSDDGFGVRVRDSGNPRAGEFDVRVSGAEEDSSSNPESTRERREPSGPHGTSNPQRLWTPWRMRYVGGERRPTPPGVSIFSAIAADPAHDAENFVLHRGARAFVVMNLYPYNTGHCMVVPYRQVATLDALDAGEMTEIGLLLPWLTRVLQTTLRCDGLNLGLNLGAVAGAGVAEHLHWHIVPRWQGDANFMPIVAKTTVMPELLPDTYAKLRATMERDPAPMLGILATPPVPQAGGVIFHGEQSSCGGRATARSSSQRGMWRRANHWRRRRSARQWRKRGSCPHRRAARHASLPVQGRRCATSLGSSWT